MRLVIVSGHSGAGKSIALHTLEDLEYYCVDNLPVGLLEAFADQMRASRSDGLFARVGVGIDVRNRPGDLSAFPATIDRLKAMGVECRVLFLQCDRKVLLRRFSETRRRHPLTRDGVDLVTALEEEGGLLESISNRADHYIDTSSTTLHELRDQVRRWAGDGCAEAPALQFQSFGFKHGVPVDSDFVFDARCLPNPYWHEELRPMTGRDQPIIDFLSSDPMVGQVCSELIDFIETWLPRFSHDNRSYITIAVGCTGGRHRSVYLVEQLAAHFQAGRDHVTVRHRELP